MAELVWLVGGSTTSKDGQVAHWLIVAYSRCGDAVTHRDLLLDARLAAKRRRRPRRPWTNPHDPGRGPVPCQSVDYWVLSVPLVEGNLDAFLADPTASRRGTWSENLPPPL